MGLCKCPKRKTTSHFCFHHCVNVCEHCIVNNHTTCVVKSYTTWLKEASGSVSSSSISASALCAVCQRQFFLTPKEIENVSNNFNDTSSTKSAIRLLCYHVVHAHCLSVYVKKLLKEGNTLKCPACARSLWLQPHQELSKDTTEFDFNELSPVALQLHKHLLDHGNWWGQALITNGKVENIEQYLHEDDCEEIVEEESQPFEAQSILENNPSIKNFSSHTSPLTIVQTSPILNSNTIHYNNYNNSELIHSIPHTTINHRSHTQQTYQPIHHRQFNNNYGIDSEFSPQQLQQQNQQQCMSINMSTNAPSSDLSNRHTITSNTPLLSNNDSNLNHDKEKDPSSKYRPKKIYNQSWSLSYQRLLQYFSGTHKAEDTSTIRITTIIICCILIIVILLVAITSYTRSNNEPFDNNNIDYGGENDEDNNVAVAHLKSYNINNL